MCSGRYISQIAVCFALLVSAACAIKTRISPSAVECYSENVEAGASVAFSFQVIHGGQLDLDVTLTSSSVVSKDEHSDTHQRITSLNHQVITKELERWDKATEGRVTFTAPTSGTDNAHGLPSRVTACFNNKMSKWTPKWYRFELFSDPSDPQLEKGDTLQTVETQLEHALHKDGNSLFQVRTMMQKLKQAESDHRDKVESTNVWMLYGTIVNGVLLMVLSVFQYWYLTKFLSVRNISLRM